MSNITYEFKILKLNVLPTLKLNETTTLNNVVTSIIFNYIGTNTSNNQTCIITNEIPLTLPTTNENYTDFNKLTEQECKNWLITTVNVENYNKQINDYFDNNKIIQLDVPWSKN